MIEIPESGKKQKQSREKHGMVFVMGGVLFVAIPILFYVLLFRDPLSTLREISPTVITEQEQRITRRSADVVSLRKLESDYRSLDPNIVKKISDSIPLSKEFPELITNMYELTRRVNARVGSFMVSETKGGAKETTFPQVNPMQIQLSLQDVSYESLKNFINLVMQNARLLTMSSLQYLPQESSAVLTLQVYYLQ